MSLFSRLASPYRFHQDIDRFTHHGANPLDHSNSWHAQSLLGNLLGRVERFVDDLFDRFGNGHGHHGNHDNGHGNDHGHGHDDDDTPTPPSEPTAPTIGLADDASDRLELDIDGGTIRGVIGDPTDPALTEGIALAIDDADTAREDLAITVTSSDEAVARAALDDNDVLRIAPVSPGNATLTVTVSDGQRESRYTLDYAAADATQTHNDARFHTGASDTSAAIAIGDGLILVGDDEDQTLRLYDHDRSGAPLESFDLDEALGITDGGEVDIESVVDAGGSSHYWLGSLSSSERSTVFATRVTGDDADSLQVEVTGQFSGLHEAILDWAAANRPEVDFDGVEVEGAMYDAGTLFLGLRAPIDSDGQALVLPVTNVDDLMDAGSADGAEFGEALGLDLDGRTIRDIKAVGDGSYLISAGPANPGDEDNEASNDDFQLYRWDGAHKAVQIEGADLNTNAEATGGTAETLSGIEIHADGSVSVDVEYDNGTTDWSADGTESKDLDETIQTFTSTTLTFDALPSLAPQPGDIAFTALDGASQSFGFVALEAITPGAELVFESGESRATWTAPASGVAAGTTITRHDEDFAGDLAFSLADGVTISAEGETLYRIGRDDAADLTLPADIDSAAYAGTTEGTAEALFEALGDANAWQRDATPSEAFSVTTGHAPLGEPEPRDLGIAVSEIWSGQSGSDITEDWFEIANTGDSAIDFGQTPLYYDDESADPAEAAQVQGLTTLAPGATAIVMVDGDEEAVDEFRQAWSSTERDDVEIGYTGSAAGLGSGGDRVTLWRGEPGRDTLAASASYPDTEDFDAASWDVVGQRFTTLADGGTASDALGGDDDDTPAVATPGRLTNGGNGDSDGSGTLLISEYVEGSGYNKALELSHSGRDAESLGADEALVIDDDYTYSFDGHWGSLDHALASESMRDQVTGATTWHINADEPIALDYNTEFKSDAQVESFYDDGPFRASDHDPVVVGVDLGADSGMTMG